MDSTNYITGIVKILESPKQKSLKNNIEVSEFRAQLPQLRGTILVKLRVCGNLAIDIEKYYKINDYILIEGYLSLDDQKNTSSVMKVSKKIIITVLKVYPLLLIQNQ
jgi:hypothetical protein